MIPFSIPLTGSAATHGVDSNCEPGLKTAAPPAGHRARARFHRLPTDKHSAMGRYVKPAQANSEWPDVTASGASPSETT
jgi:hypothetical protein